MKKHQPGTIWRGTHCEIRLERVLGMDMYRLYVHNVFSSSWMNYESALKRAKEWETKLKI